MAVSLDLYTTALVWYAQRGGAAKLWGRLMPLRDAPQLLGLRLMMVEYRPEIGEQRLQPFDGAPRDMLRDEVRAADEFLLTLFRRG